MLNVHPLELVYRDLKTANFIVSDPDADFLKLVGIDLASALTFAEGSKTKNLDGTTPGYVASELDDSEVRKFGYGPLQDYYSLGIVLTELLTCSNFQQNLEEAIKAQETWH